MDKRVTARSVAWLDEIARAEAELSEAYREERWELVALIESRIKEMYSSQVDTGDDDDEWR